MILGETSSLMKHLLLIVFIAGGFNSIGQLRLPELSPVGRIAQEAGYTNIVIRYGRPQIRGRQIMGGVVPFDRLWRTGAGKCTMLSFDNDVTINGTIVLAGAYALVSIPGEDKWTIMLNMDTSKVYGDPSEYDPSKEIVRMEISPEETGHTYESLTIFLDVVRGDVVFNLAWENTWIRFPIQTGSIEKAVATIEDGLRSEPDNVDMLATAAWFYEWNGLDRGQVMDWLNRALAIRDDRWVYHQKVEVLEKMGNYAEARTTAEKAIAFLKKAKPDGDGWEHSVRAFEKKLKRWPK